MKMADSNELDDIFGVGYPPPEEIRIDEEEEARKYKVAQRKRMFSEWIVFRKEKGAALVTPPAENTGNAFLAMAPWTTEHRVFAVEQFFRNNYSVVTVQRLFRR